MMMVWVKRALIVVVGGVLLGALLLYGATELLLRRRANVDLPPIRAGITATDYQEGARLARITGCTRCHGAQGEGRVLAESPLEGRMVAPALVRVAQDGSDEQLARAVRNGVSIRATRLFGMPTATLNHLADHDVARIIAWMRTLPVTGRDVIGRSAPGPATRLDMLMGRLPSALNRANDQPVERPRSVGAYLVSISCAACHDVTRERDGSPALASAVAGFEAADRRALLRGEAPRFTLSAVPAHRGLELLRPEEMADIRAYLRGAGASAVE